MASSISFGFNVIMIVGVCRQAEANALFDYNAVFSQLADLVWVVGHQPDGRQA